MVRIHPGPHHFPERTVFLFDGDCAFCRRAAAWLAKRAGVVELIAWQRVDDLSALGLTQDDVATAVYLVGADTAHGHRAIGRALRLSTSPTRRLLGRVLLLRLLDRPAAAAYRWVARNRHRFAPFLRQT